jgi:hypothetical protein
VSSLFLLFVFSLPHLGSNKSHHGLVLKSMLALELGGVKGKVTSKGRGGLGENCNGAFEVGNMGSFLLNEHGVGDHEVVVNTLTHSNLGTSLVLEGAEGEGKSRETLVGFGEELARLVDLQVVHVLDLTLVHGGAHITLLGLTFTSGNVNVKSNNITGSENPLINVSLGGLLGNNNIVAINAELLNGVGQNALNHVYAVVSTDLVHSLSYFNVSGTILDDTFTSHHSVVGSKKGICLAGSDLANGDSGGSNGGKAVDVAASNDLNQIAFLDGDTLVREGREVTNNIVDAHASGESDSALKLLCLLGVVHGLELGFHFGVDSLTDSVYIGVLNAELNGFGKSG